MINALYETNLVTKTYFVSFIVNNLCLCIKHIVWANLHFERTAMIIKYDKFFINMEKTQHYINIQLYFYEDVCL